MSEDPKFIYVKIKERPDWWPGIALYKNWVSQSLLFSVFFLHEVRSL